MLLALRNEREEENMPCRYFFGSVAVIAVPELYLHQKWVNNFEQIESRLTRGFSHIPSTNRATNNGQLALLWRLLRSGTADATH